MRGERRSLISPQAEICQYSGREPASQEARDERGLVSQSVYTRQQRAKAFDRGRTRDLLGLLRPHLLQTLGTKHRGFPAQFIDLSCQGYLAVVKVDGNRVAKRRGTHLRGPFQGYFDRWLRAESFFYSLRSGLRQAVAGAIGEVFSGEQTRQGHVPLRLLMLGGDDLLLVCGAPYALPFVVALDRHLQGTTRDLTTVDGGRGPLTIGAGVAIVQDSFPFHRAHQLAEQLATSAKRLRVQAAGQDVSAVDWIVTSEAWHGDIQQTRQHAAVIDDQLILCAKPYRIRPPEPGTTPAREATDKSLEELLADAQALAGTARQGRDPGIPRAARSQLQRLGHRLADGRRTAQFVADTLPASVRGPLVEKGYLSRANGPWQPCGKRWLTRIPDLLELYELERLRQLERATPVPASASIGQPEEETQHA